MRLEFMHLSEDLGCDAQVPVYFGGEGPGAEKFCSKTTEGLRKRIRPQQIVKLQSQVCPKHGFWQYEGWG